MEEKYYSTIEVAKILNVSRKTVFQWARDGKIRATRVGKNYIIPHAVVLEKLGKTIGTKNKNIIEKSIDRALSEYEETFRLLGKE